MAERETGTVISWHSEKGWGFLRPDMGGSDIFFHVKASFNNVVPDIEPAVGEKVEFEHGTSTRDPGKTMALHVRFLEDL